ncbi:MAG: hypothetical protein K0S74_527 [Chlamydiales bacterium]|jgi:hypothetical protein|nr:hypothetical protein [Chlamydiales bacterium]
MFRGFIYSVFFLAALGYGGWWLWTHNPSVENFVERHMPQAPIYTFEMRYTAENILENYNKQIVKNTQYEILAPTIQFYPYLMLEVKYSKESQTGEGIILWGLADGEMVTNTNTWEKTHGFKDCLHAHTTREEFKIINTIAKSGSKCDRAKLIQALNMDEDILDNLLASCRKKKLIVQTGNDYRLHFDNPRLNVLPETFINEPLVTQFQPESGARIPKAYSSVQIKEIANSAFGLDFAIRSEKEVFLPVHKIVVKNTRDGSLITTYWNSLNGKQMQLFSLQ